MNALSVQARVRRAAFLLDVDFTAPLDGVTAVFGPSGAGKSMLLSAIAGLMKLEAGRVALGDAALEDTRLDKWTPPHARGVGMVFQDARLFPHLTVHGNLEFARKRAPEGRALLGIAEAAQRFDLTPLLDRPIRNLSGGEKMRVALARALLSAPDILLLDEPFSALDGARRRAFLTALRALHEKFKLPMLVVTHQIEDVALLADHVVGLREGRVAAAGPVAEVTLEKAFKDLLDRRDYGAAMDIESFECGRAWVRADNVLIAVTKPQGLSARNVWPGEITEISEEPEGAHLVRATTGRGIVLSRITADAARELQLARGQSVWMVVKTNSL